MSGDALPSRRTGRATPTASSERISSLDAVRGVATFGILIMNALSFGLIAAAYFNLDAGGSDHPIDWAVGAISLIFVDQKMMALFSLLFGAGVVMFADRAEAKGRRVWTLSLWRFLLLLLIGLAHTALWDGDVLSVYAVCAPVVLALRRWSPRLLLIVGSALALAGTATAALFQSTLGADGDGLGELWLTDDSEMSDAVFGYFVLDGAGRALGLMLIGVALYRLGIVQGQRDDELHRRMIRWGLGVGVPLAAASLVWRVASDWGPETALTGHIPAGLATIPLALGYLGILIRWNQRDGRLVERFRNVGRMALTNYLAQTVLGVLVLTELLSDVALGRTAIACFVVAVWALQLWWSTAWLERFSFGPVEWLWRCATYRKWQPLRRPPGPARLGSSATGSG